MFTNNRKDENLKKLFEKFGDSKQAEQAAKDIASGEKILHDNPAPQPDDQVIAGIKARLAKAASRGRKNTPNRATYKTAAIAAAIILIAIISIKLFEQDSTKPESLEYASIIPAAIWESEYLDQDDSELANLTAQIEQIEGEMIALQLYENGSSIQAEWEAEFEESNNNY